MPEAVNKGSDRELFQRLTMQVMAVLILSLLAAHGVFAQKVTMEFDQAADFGKYKTFAIREGNLNSKNPALNSDLVKKRIDADIDRKVSDGQGSDGGVWDIRSQRAIPVRVSPQDAS